MDRLKRKPMKLKAFFVNINKIDKLLNWSIKNVQITNIRNERELSLHLYSH